MCLFLEDRADAGENYTTEQYANWKDKAFVYYLRLMVAEYAGEMQDNLITRKVVPVNLCGV